MQIDKRVIELSDLIAQEAPQKAACYPVDRYFLEHYVQNILQLNTRDFLFYNLENVNPNYTTQLLLCLPELWENITVDDLIELVSKFTNIFSFYTLISFTFKYIEINIIELILSLHSVAPGVKKDVRRYLKNQYPNLIKSEGELFLINEDIVGIRNDQWLYIKQVLLLDQRIKPALNSSSELKKYVESL